MNIALLMEETLKKHPELRGKSFEEILALHPPRNLTNPLFTDAPVVWDGYDEILETIMKEAKSNRRENE